MVENISSRWGQLERWSAGAFFVAGGLFVLFAGFWGAFAFTEMTSESVQNVLGPAGWTAAFIGLLGVYPRLATPDSRLPQLGATFASIGCVGGLVTTIGNLTPLAGVGSLPSWVDALQLFLLIGIIPGFLTYALIIIRQHTGHQRLGLLFAVPAIVFALNILRVATLGSTTPRWSPFVLGATQALALLAIGFTIHTTPPRTDEPTPSPDPTTK